MANVVQAGHGAKVNQRDVHLDFVPMSGLDLNQHDCILLSHVKRNQSGTGDSLKGMTVQQQRRLNQLAKRFNLPHDESGVHIVTLLVWNNTRPVTTVADLTVQTFKYRVI